MPLYACRLSVASNGSKAQSSWYRWWMSPRWRRLDQLFNAFGIVGTLLLLVMALREASPHFSVFEQFLLLLSLLGPIHFIWVFGFARFSVRNLQADPNPLAATLAISCVLAATLVLMHI